MMATDTLSAILDAIREDVDDQASWCALCDVLQEEGLQAPLPDSIPGQAMLAQMGYILAGATADGRDRCRYVKLNCHGYAEPGYSDPECGVIALGNWNTIDHYHEETHRFVADDASPSHLGDILDKLGVPCEWSDEWSSCSECGKLVRTEPDCHDWEPAYHISDSGIYCRECRAPDTSDD